MTKLRTRALVLAAAFMAVSRLVSCAPKCRESAVCPPSSCGAIPNIGSPFRLQGDPPGCGCTEYELKCEEDKTILEMYSATYWVKAIWYEDQAIQVIDANARTEVGASFLLSEYNRRTDPEIGYSFWWKPSTGSISLINCTMPVESGSFVEANSCMANASSPGTEAAGTEHYLYWSLTNCYVPCGLPQGCHVEGTWPTEFHQQVDGWENLHCAEVLYALLQGFNLTWEANTHCYDVFSCPSTDNVGNNPFDSVEGIIRFVLSRSLGCVPVLIRGPVGDYFVIDSSTRCVPFLFIVVLPRLPIGYIALLAFLIYKLGRRLLGINDDVEMFLAEYRNCMPTRYTYRQIRKMTGDFKEKLGQGGFGSVYRGKQLAGRRPVAVKVLDKSDSNGQDFINEVATIGRIHHSNVVQLMGFCVEGSKRALVYEFMPNGSLDRYIYDQEPVDVSGKFPLSWRKMLEIAVGIARGIEYLHCGCDVKILHFDIKPQNVLLDEDFNPKIADFGLAKSYPAEKNTVTVTAVRGTIGYMAPELFYASAGSVSGKSDVYSFGMLLMEMAGRRKNMDPGVESSSGKDYLPSWIYNQLEQGKDFDMNGTATEEEKNIMHKLFIIALWCIQMRPDDRPSIGNVVGMLEGDNVQQLQMPARPFLASTDLVNLQDIVASGSVSSDTSTAARLNSDADYSVRIL